MFNNKRKLLYNILVVIGVVICYYLLAGLSLVYAQDLPPLPFLDKDKKEVIPTLDSTLRDLQDVFELSGRYAGNQFATENSIFMDDGYVKVMVEMESSKLAAQFQVRGAKLLDTIDNVVKMSVPVGDLKDLALRPGVKFVYVPCPGVADQDYPIIGDSITEMIPFAVTSQGVAATKTDKWHAKGYKGKNVKIGIIDGGFTGYKSLLGTELPPSSRVIAKSFRSDGNLETGTHGRSCAEIVCDMAPEATLYLVNADTDQVSMSSAANYLISQKVKVISCSLGFLDSPGDGTGKLCRKVRDAYNAGILWCKSSGNYARTHYEGYFSDTDKDGWHNYSGTDESMNIISVKKGGVVSIRLRWNNWGTYNSSTDTWSGSNQDYDLYLYNSSGIVAKSEKDQTGTQPPMEWFDWTATADGTYYVAVRKYNAPLAPHYLEIYSLNHDLSEYEVKESSLSIPADSTYAVAVGAANYSSLSLGSYSSWGPLNKSGGGQPLYGYQSPWILGPDGVSTSLGTFSGTSAAAPHAAGAAAVLLSRYSSYTPNNILKVFISNGRWLSGYGSRPNYGYGYGFLTMPTP